MTPSDLPERIAAKIAVDPDTQCWTWVAAIDPTGYGRAWHDGAQAYAHRVVYHLLTDSLFPVYGGLWGLTLDHHVCGVKRCVNPAHLEPVTRGENVRRYYASLRAMAVAA